MSTKYIDFRVYTFHSDPASHEMKVTGTLEIRGLTSMNFESKFNTRWITTFSKQGLPPRAEHEIKKKIHNMLGRINMPYTNTTTMEWRYD